MSTDAVTVAMPGCTCGNDTEAHWLDHQDGCRAPLVTLHHMRAALGACIQAGALTEAEEFTISSVLSIAGDRHGMPGCFANSGLATLQRNVDAVLAEGGGAQ